MDPWERNPMQRIEDAKEHKRLGTEKFKVCLRNVFICIISLAVIILIHHIEK